MCIQCYINQASGIPPIDHRAEEAHQRQLDKETIYEKLIRLKAYHVARLEMINKLLDALYENPKISDFMNDLREFHKDYHES